MQSPKCMYPFVAGTGTLIIMVITTTNAIMSPVVTTLSFNDLLFVIQTPPTSVTVDLNMFAIAESKFSSCCAFDCKELLTFEFTKFPFLTANCIFHLDHTFLLLVYLKNDII